MSKGTPTQYVAILSGLAEDYGCSKQRLLKGTRLNPHDLESINSYVSKSDFAVLVNNAYRATGVNALGIELGARLNISSHITLGYAIMNCPTFGDAMDCFLKYYRIIVSNTIVSDGKIGNLRHINIGVKKDQLVPEHFVLETYFAALYTAARFLLQMRDLPFQLELAYPAPSHEKDYHRFFGDNVTFNNLQNSLSFPLSLAKCNVVTANASLLAIYEQQCKTLLKNIEREDSITDKIYQLLSQFDGGYPTLEKAAKLLALSPRTLRRRLESEKTGYQKILDDVRKDQAIDLLTHSTVPLSTISYTLGYKDISNFRRAFIKWTGKSPLDYRRGSSL